MLKGKTVLLGVTGGIACYKSAGLASALVKQGANVQVLMTRNATEFIGPHTFESLTGNRVSVDTFDRNYQFQVEHIALADRTDLVIVAPATANVCAKLAHGLADDMLTTTVLACTCPKLLVPAMNTNMYENPATQENLSVLRQRGYIVMEPLSGHLACGAVGKGKMPEPDDIYDRIEAILACKKDLQGLRILVTAGPTQEALDPVRYLTNHSTGRMGYAIAREAMLRGANVTLVSGPTELGTVPFVDHRPVTSAGDMFRAIQDLLPQTDILIKAAAVADYCLDDDQSLFDAETLEAVRSLVTVSGRSFSDPVYNDDGTVNADASRRVEIKFRLSDDEMINRMLDILDAYGEAADTPAAPEGTPAP